MNFPEYQLAAAVTAEPKAFDHAYLVPMIVGETGELFGQKAKAHWHGWDADRLETELVSEYGDIAWGTAILLAVEGVGELTEPEYATSKLDDPWQSLLYRSTYLHLWYTGNREGYIKREAQGLWRTLEANCELITGVSFDTVLNYNLKKLADRAARGVLKGSGDHR